MIARNLASSLGIVLFGLVSITTAAPGDLDPTFGGTGFAREAGSLGSGDEIRAIAVQSDGKIVSVGTVNNGDVVSCAIARYNADGSVDTSFDSDGKTIVQMGVEFICNDVAIQNDGKLIVVGYVRFGTIYNFAVLRYNSNGSPDTSFDSDGRKINAFVNGDLAYGVAIQTDGKIVVAGSIGDEFAVARYNPDGSFDTSFDGDGWVATDFFGGPDHARSIAIENDGKIVIAGNGRPLGGSFNDFAVARYNTNGSLDPSFDGDGKVLTDILGNNDNAQDVSVGPDGKIVVGGRSWGINDQFGLARYNSDGSLDTSFDGDGKLSSDITPFPEYLNELGIQSDGKIIAAGLGSQAGGKFLIVRYNTNGSFDNSWDDDGIVLVSAGSTHALANAVTIQTDGKVIAAGYGTGDTTSFAPDFALTRLNPNGSLDTSFDGDGSVVSNIYSWRIQANAITIQPDGKIVAVGKRITGNNDEDFAINRYNPDGTLDTSFDSDGRVTTNVHFGYDRAYAVAMQPDGKILVAGEGNSVLVIARYNPDGSLDNSFDGDGKIVDAENGSFPYIRALAIQPDGKIVAAGRSYEFGPGFASTVYRFNPDGSRDGSFDVDGKVRTDLGGDDEFTSISLQSDGKIVAAGKALNGTSYDFTVARYNSSGSPDTSFDGDGIATIDFVGGYDYVDAMAIQTDGKFVVVGESSGDNNIGTPASDSAIARLNADGSFDSSFDSDGKIRLSLSPYLDLATGVAIQPDGKIVTAGSAFSIQNGDLGTLEKNVALVRFNSDGSFDNGYGVNGKAIVDLFTQDSVNDVVLDSGGRAVVAGETDGFFTVARFLGGTAVTSVRSPFDFDGDGKSDISIFRPSNGQWWYQGSSNNQVLAFQFGSSADQIVPADYTGDGKTDIAFWRSSTGEWFVLRSEDHTYYAHPYGVSSDIPTPGDFDADGKADQAVFRPSNATWYIHRSTGGDLIQQFGQNGDAPAVGDYDGDGKADVAIFRPSNGQWWLNRSTAGIIAFTFGVSTDRLVQGDYTGDGKTDAAFWRPSTGEWFVLRSEDFSYYAVPFGTTGDVPVPGDYDGDGRFDTSVFRPSTVNWYINRTTAGLLIQQFGQAGDKPVPSAFVP